MKSIIGQMCQLFFRTFPQYNNKHSFWLSFERKYYGRFCFLFDKKHVQTFRSNRDGACIHQSMSMVDEKKDDFPNIAWMYAWVSRKFIHTYLCRNVSINFFFSLPFSVWIFLCRKKIFEKKNFNSIECNLQSNPIKSIRIHRYPAYKLYSQTHRYSHDLDYNKCDNCRSKFTCATHFSAVRWKISHIFITKLVVVLVWLWEKK